MSDPIEGQEPVSCYFELSGQLLVGHVMYWEGDSNAMQYREVLHEVIESIRLLAR